MPSVVLQHGLGSHATSLLGVEWYLNWCGYADTHRVSYPATTELLDACVAHVDGALAALLPSHDAPLIVIGQGMHHIFFMIIKHTRRGQSRAGSRRLSQCRAGREPFDWHAACTQMSAFGVHTNVGITACTQTSAFAPINRRDGP
jgi:hypothetical protein